MVSGTGCLGLSMRTTVLTAAAITLVESAAWLALSVTSYLTYTCIFTIPKDLHLHMRLTLIIYYLNPECHDLNNLEDLTPAGQNRTLSVDGDGVATAQRTALLSIVYIAVSFLWFGSSLVFLATIVGRLPGRPAARLCYPWIIITTGTMLIDLVAMGFYAADAADFETLASVKSASNVDIPEQWLAGYDSSFVLKTGPLIILAVTVRGVVLWLLNGVLLVHVARAVRIMVNEDGGIRKPQRRRRKVPPSPAPSRSGSPHHIEAEMTPELAFPPTSDTPLAATTEPAHADAVPEPGPPPAAVAKPVVTAQTPTPTTAGPTLSTQSTPTATRRAPQESQGRQGPLGRAGSRRSTSPPAQVWQAPVKVLPGLPADRHHQLHQPAASKEEIVQRLERFGIRSSAGNSHYKGQWDHRDPRDHREYWDHRDFRDREPSTSPRVPPKGRLASVPHEYHDYYPEHHAPSRPNREMSRLYTRTQSVEGRRAREHEDAPRRRPGASLERTHSERAVAGEWRMGQRPPGNLHGLSPLHSPRSHPVHAVQSATGELKKNLPWSYLTGPPTDPDKSLVVHNVYLPPSGREGEPYQRSPSSAPRRDDRYHRDGLY